MKKLYEKNELSFSVLWIVIYVVVTSLMDKLSADAGHIKLFSLIFHAVLTVLLAVLIKELGIRKKCGLCGMNGASAKGCLYFLPLIPIMSVNLVCGIEPVYSGTDALCYVLSMLFVGFLEEILFRGFLFRAIERTDGSKKAIIISGLTFGIGHIVNLLNGAELLSTLLQICYAVSVGILFTVIFYKSGSLIPCIIAHSVINSTSVLSGAISEEKEIIVSAALFAVSAAYAAWIRFKAPDNECAEAG